MTPRSVALRAAAGLFLIVAAHALLVTARDALLLPSVPPSLVPLAYLGGALAAWGLSRLPSLGALRRLLWAGALGTLVLIVAVSVPLAVYVWSVLLTSVLVPRLWVLASAALEGAGAFGAEGRRWFVWVNAGGVLGGAVGALAAAGLLAILPAGALLVLAATSLAAATLPLTDLDRPRASAEPRPLGRAARQDHVWRLVLLAAAGTAAGILLDFLQKRTLVGLQGVDLPVFVARLHVAENLIAVIVQLLVAPALIARLTPPRVVLVLPALVAIGALAGAWAGSFWIAVFLAGVDGAVRHSLHRTAAELLQVPLPAATRGRARRLIELVGNRVTQVVVALALLGGASALGARGAELVAAGATLLWLIAAFGAGRSYRTLLHANVAAEHVRVQGPASFARISLAPDVAQVPMLLPLLAEREMREIARRAIVAVGAPAVPLIAAALADPGLPRNLRLHLPRTLSRFARPEVPAIFLDRLEQEQDGAVRFKLLRGLGRLRFAHPELPLDEDRVLALARKQVQRAIDVLAWRLARPEGLVAELLADKEEHAIERAFRLVALLRPEVDYELYHRALRSESRGEREVARELLADTLPDSLGAALLALVDDATDERRLAAASRFHRPRPLRLGTDHSEVLRRLAAAA